MSAPAASVASLAEALTQRITRPWTLMEVCGGQTHSLLRWGLDQLLPADLRLIHGPGCPVCVTPAATIDQALALARTPGVILCTYGDMLRVPGTERGVDLLAVRAEGGNVQLLTTPLQALRLAQERRDQQVVFLAVGFETTAPATALLARQAFALGLNNLSLLTVHVRVAPAMEAILADPANQVEAFLAAGHVCSVIGTGELEELVGRFQVPVVVTGFEPADLMAGLLEAVELLEAGKAQVANAYPRVVRAEGNAAARASLEEVFQPVDQPWRGMGVIPQGGMALKPPYDTLEARQRFSLADPASGEEPVCPTCNEVCISG
ncbi:MAG: hydrogenase formation protein HypD, partial [Cyanobium sp.]